MYIAKTKVKVRAWCEAWTKIKIEIFKLSVQLFLLISDTDHWSGLLAAQNGQMIMRIALVRRALCALKTLRIIELVLPASCALFCRVSWLYIKSDHEWRTPCGAFWIISKKVWYYVYSTADEERHHWTEVWWPTEKWGPHWCVICKTKGK